MAELLTEIPGPHDEVVQPEASAEPPGPRAPGPSHTAAPASRQGAAAVGEPRLSVAAVARWLGIAPATLRTWDRRYGIGPSEHTPAPPAAGVRPVLLAGMPGELHILPMVVLSAALAQRRVPCRSLGADLPASALVSAIRRTTPVAVVLWSQLPSTADPDMLRSLPRTRPQVRTFVAGPGWAGVDLPPRILSLDSLVEATDAISTAASV